jgi:dipeptidyl aminopeptidase/acylaminoacyl peptidase
MLSFGGMSSVAKASDLDTYLADYQLRAIALSPDGEKLAMIHRLSDNPKRVPAVFGLSVLDVDNGFQPILSMREEDNRQIADVRWYDSERLLLTTATLSRSAGVQSAYTRIVAIDADGRNAVNLLGENDETQDEFDLSNVVSVVPGDADHLLMYVRSSTPYIYRVNVRTGAGEKLIRGNKRTVWWGVSARGDVRLRMDYLPSRRQLSVYRYDLSKKEWLRISRFRLHETRENALQTAGLLHDDEILLLDRKEDDDFIALYRYDPGENALGERVFGVDGYDLFSATYDQFTGHLVGVSFIDDRQRFVYFDSAIQAIQETLEQRFSNGVVQIGSVSFDRNRVLFYTSSPWNPGTFYLYDRREDRITSIAAFNPALAKDPRTTVEVIRYVASDGAELVGYLTFGNGVEPRESPLVVYPHGGPHWRDWLRFDVFAQYWASKGYLVFQPNFRGSIGYGRKFLESGYGEYGGRMIDDIAAGVRSLIKAGYADAERVCAAGISYGGYAALMLAAKTELLTCAVSINGPTDIAQQVKFDRRGFRGEEKKLFREMQIEVIGDFEANRELLKSISPIAQASTISSPVLLIHAEDDAVVDFAHSKRMNRELRRAGLESRLVEIEEGGHGLASRDALRAALEQSAEFLGRYLQ